MSGERPVAVKICGLTRTEDARIAGEAGADYVGAILVEGTPRAVTPERAREIGEAAGRPLVLVVADLPLPALLSAIEDAGPAIVQLHGEEDPEWIAELRTAAPGIRLWKALRVRGPEDVAVALRRFAGRVDGLLLDGWDPLRKGGTGKTFPWEEVAPLRAGFPASLSFVAAGGLTAENVGEMIGRLHPDIVDVGSGVERVPGEKDPDRIHAFIAEVRASRSRVLR